MDRNIKGLDFFHLKKVSNQAVRDCYFFLKKVSDKYIAPEALIPFGNGCGCIVIVTFEATVVATSLRRLEIRLLMQLRGFDALFDATIDVTVGALMRFLRRQ